MSLSTMGSRLEQARIAQGFSVRQLATRIGVKPATVDNWERDRSEPRANKLLTLAGMLNVPVLWLLQGEDRSGRDYNVQVFSETAAIRQKLERATTMQQELTALLVEATADLARLQRDLDAEEELAA